NFGPKEWINLEKELQYRSTIKSHPYFYMETKSLADLMLQGFNENEIKEKVIEENIFQVTSETRKKGIASAILKRLQPLDEYLIEMIHNSDIETSKTIVLYSIMKTDRLFFEFMHEVFRDKVNYQDT